MPDYAATPRTALSIPSIFPTSTASTKEIARSKGVTPAQLAEDRSVEPRRGMSDWIEFR
jgi:hypothetical protein